MPLKTMVATADNLIDKTKKPLYLITMGFIYIGYIIVFLGISYISPSYIRIISNITYALIGLILVYKFNPMRESPTLTDYDSNLIFISATFILFNLGITEFALSFFNTVKSSFGL